MKKIFEKQQDIESVHELKKEITDNYTNFQNTF